MHVVVDCTMIKAGQAGLRTVAVGLSRALGELPGMRVTVLTLPSTDADWGVCDVHLASLRSGDANVRTVWREAALDPLLRRLGADVLLVPAPERLRRCSVPQVVIVHDLGPLVAPALYGRTRYIRYLVSMGSTVRSVDAVVCVSQATRLDLIRWTGIKPDRVTVAHNGLQVRPSPGERAGRLNAPSSETFTLYVGAVLPHKNVDVLIDAYRAPIAGMPSRLVMVGPDYGGEAASLIERAAGIPNVEHRGFVSASELEDLYRDASVLAFPSLHEGFGIPVLEGMAHGVPVVASDIPALREAGGSVPWYVTDPTSAVAWREALRSPSTSADIGERIAAGTSRAAEFTWSRMAGTVRGALEGVRSSR